MHGPDGVDDENQVAYLEILPPQRLSYRHSGLEETADIQFQTTASFADIGGKTELTLWMVFPSKDERDRVVRERGAIEGGKQTLERFAEKQAKG